jgi:N-carbamoyl-L-amino-acid hydrolase
VTAPRIDSQRLWKSLMDLARIGAYQDNDSGLTGVNRLALSDADAQGRAQVKRWFAEAGLEVRVDRVGNVYGRRAGRKGGPPVLCGSHIDSVPTGGAFDGALGVLGGLEVVRALDDAKVETERPIEIAFFTEEEGVRFGTDMLGSAVAVGRIALDAALALRDGAGLTVGEELRRIGFAGDHPPRLEPPHVPHAYVECHIEQGPVLAAAGMELGVVTGCQAISWQELAIAGRSAHAGTTPMELRRDAGLAASLVNVRIHEMVRSGRYGDLRATMGRLDLHPDRINIVPSRATCTVDLRNPDDARMAQAEQDLAGYLKEVERQARVTITARQTARTGSVRFDPKVQEIIGGHIDAAGLRQQRILSGAGHDAQELAAICPTAMIFVPGEHEGISHNPREYSTPKACADGVGVLLATLLALAND